MFNILLRFNFFFFFKDHLQAAHPPSQADSTVLTPLFLQAVMQQTTPVPPGPQVCQHQAPQ